MASKDKPNPHEYVEKVVQHTQQFIEETLRENERLRALTVRLEGERVRNADQILELKELIAKLQLQQVRQQQQMSQAESDNQRFSAEFNEIEQQNSNLANLYVASYRLYSSLDRREVLQVMQEVIINLIGSEELGIFELDDSRRQLKLLASFGIDEREWSIVPLDDSPIAETARSGEMFLRDPPPNHQSSPPSSLTAVIPLKVEGKVIGVIAVFRLLPQKRALVAVDRELFALLGSHAAMALYCSGLHARLAGGR
ncbi:MAG TPA: GAF domain-containing protein [Polyangiales bacterium]|nr:GAF domain-containing protein [Polyangiales bacterium]